MPQGKGTYGSQVGRPKINKGIKNPKMKPKQDYRENPTTKPKQDYFEKASVRKTLPGRKPVTGKQTKENLVRKTLPGKPDFNNVLKKVTGKQTKENSGLKPSQAEKNPSGGSTAPSSGEQPNNPGPSSGGSLPKNIGGRPVTGEQTKIGGSLPNNPGPSRVGSLPKNPGRKTVVGGAPKIGDLLPKNPGRVTGEQTKENTAGVGGALNFNTSQAKKNPGPKINKGTSRSQIGRRTIYKGKKNPKMKPKQDYFEMASQKSMKGMRGKMK